MVLKGHRSIVNQVRFNPHSYMICSSGVEKVIKVSWNAGKGAVFHPVEMQLQLFVQMLAEESLRLRLCAAVEPLQAA